MFDIQWFRDDYHNQMAESVNRLKDGSFDFSEGVDSSKVTTIQSNFTPNGLQRNELAWASNCGMRDGGITCRSGWQPRVDINKALSDAKAQGVIGIFQGGWLYFTGFITPYFVLSIGGRIYKVEINGTVTDLSAQFSLTNPATPIEAFFCQAEEFLIIQAGDYFTQPKTNPTPPPTPPADRTTTLSNWLVPYTTNSNTITLNAAYGGVIGDTVSLLFQYSPGNFAEVFRLYVSNISGSNITVTNAMALQTAYAALDGPYTIRKFSTPPPTPPGAAPTLPLFWDGTTLRRSKGITTTAPASMSNGINEIPAATCMDYYRGRLWYAQGQSFSAGDIVGGPSGTAFYYFRDSVLNVTENPLCFGGDGFSLPSNSGNIRSLFNTASLNEQLGQGDLYIATISRIFRLQVPTTRADWIAADNNNQPLLTPAQGRGGVRGARCVVPVNSDVFFRSPDGISSLTVAVQNFGQWGNTPISNNIIRIFNFEDKSLLRLCSGINFDNRMLQTCLPRQTDYGVVYDGIASLDFNLISTLQSKLPPAWEGVLSGASIMQLWESDFGGVQRAFALVLSDTNTFQIWELTTTDRFDDQQNAVKRIFLQAETPAFTFGKEMDMKKLDGAEIWIDRIYGTIEVTVEYRPDADGCWHFWYSDSYCSSRSSCETIVNPVCYPTQPYAENYKFPIVLGVPPAPDCQGLNARPVNIGFQFQVRISIKGWARIRGVILFALPFDRQPFAGLNASRQPSF